MKRVRALLLVALGGLAACSAPAPAPPAFDPLVELRAFDPRLHIDLAYADADNFTGRAWYPDQRAWLRRSAAERLSRVQDRLARQGLGLVVWDAFRPLAVQRAMWAILPDPNFVADPARGSRHNRGAAVDVGLVDYAGRALAMPTAHDDFSERAGRDYAELPPLLIERRERLRAAMEAEGFTTISSEWWHYDAPGWEQLPLLDGVQEGRAR